MKNQESENVRVDIGGKAIDILDFSKQFAAMSTKQDPERDYLGRYVALIVRAIMEYVFCNPDIPAENRSFDFVNKLLQNTHSAKEWEMIFYREDKQIPGAKAYTKFLAAPVPADHIRAVVALRWNSCVRAIWSRM